MTKRRIYLPAKNTRTLVIESDTMDVSYAISILVEDYQEGIITRRKMANDIGDIIAELAMERIPKQIVICEKEV